MRRVLVASLFLLSAACSVFGADAYPPPPQAPPVARPITYDWTGVYFGGNAGYGVARLSAEATVGGLTTSVHEDLSGGIAGGQLGGNLQFGSFVIGAEIDGQWSDQKKTTTVVGATYVDKVSWLATARLRAGMAVDRFHAFVSFGGGASEFKRTTTFRAGLISNTIATASNSTPKVHGAVAASIGVEGAVLPNLILRAEYLVLASIPEDKLDFGVRIRTYAVDGIARLAISYKFGGGYVQAMN
jgi:outer membrane immunogenic protein